MEIVNWKDIKNYEGKYQINENGEIRSLKFINNQVEKKRKKPLIIKPQVRNNYLIVNLCKNGIRKQYSVHRLVAETFIENPNNYNIVNHKDFNTFNNNVENLEWCTQKENVNYSKQNMIGKSHIFGNKENYGIFYRKRYGRYELTIKKKYYGSFENFESAKERRNQILNELNIAI